MVKNNVCVSNKVARILYSEYVKHVLIDFYQIKVFLCVELHRGAARKSAEIIPERPDLVSTSVGNAC